MPLKNKGTKERIQYKYKVYMFLKPYILTGKTLEDNS